jgi:hypothetical protein
MSNDIPQDDASREQRDNCQQLVTPSQDSRDQPEGDMQETWRKIAEDMHAETDATKLFDLADQLIANFDCSESTQLRERIGTDSRATERECTDLDARDDTTVPHV